jgi:hypothetical protein
MTKLAMLLVAIATLVACKSGDPQVRANIQAQVEGTKPQLDQCYQIALARNRKTAGGFFTVDAVIEGNTGQFKDVVVRRDEVQDPAVRHCVVMALRSLKLATPPGGNNKQVSFAFRFTPTE